MLYVCTACGLVYFWETTPEDWPACRGCRAVNKYKKTEIKTSGIGTSLDFWVEIVSE